MSFDLNTLPEDQLRFYNSKHPYAQNEILKHLNDGLPFDKAVTKEACESLVSYYDWVKNNIKDTDKYKLDDWDDLHHTNYTGDNLTEFQKQLFDTLPNVGKWQVGNYSRMWRGLQEAEECLMEFVYHEVDYLNHMNSVN